MLCCRADKFFSVAFLERYQENSLEEHWQALKRVLRYLQRSKNKKLVFKPAQVSNKLVRYADADWASEVSDRKSVSSFIFSAYGCPISWASRKQSTVAVSSSKAEYVSVSVATQEVIWIRGLLTDLNEALKGPTKIYENNRGCICMANN